MRSWLALLLLLGCGAKDSQPQEPYGLLSVTVRDLADAGPSAGPQPGADYEYQPIDAGPSIDAAPVQPCTHAAALSDPQGTGFAVVLVIDRSGSMSGPKLAAAKEAARKTHEALDDADQISVVAFDSQPITLVPLQPASNRVQIAADISRLQAGGGTNLYPALQQAYEMLEAVSIAGKHVVVLSDGRSPYEGLRDLGDEMLAKGITISSLGIGLADRQLLRLISEAGQGCFHMIETDYSKSVPHVMVGDVLGARDAKQAAAAAAAVKHKKRRRKSDRRRKRK